MLYNYYAWTQKCGRGVVEIPCVKLLITHANEHSNVTSWNHLRSYGRSLPCAVCRSSAAPPHATREAFINTHRNSHALRITILQITIIVYGCSINTFLYWFLPYCPGVLGRFTTGNEGGSLPQRCNLHPVQTPSWTHASYWRDAVPAIHTRLLSHVWLLDRSVSILTAQIKQTATIQIFEFLLLIWKNQREKYIEHLNCRSTFIYILNPSIRAKKLK